MQYRFLLYYCFLALFLLAGCSHFRKIEKSPDWRIKYDAANAYYLDKDYYKASVLYEQIQPVVRGLPEGEKTQFYLAYCQFNQRLYLLASEQFKTFYETYGRSPYAEEARYMYSVSLFQSSPNYNLDQSSSITAMASMQDFLNRFPDTKFRESAIDIIVTIQDKLEKKGFENARQYYKMRYYEAAVVSLENFKKSFPDSKYQEQAQYLIVTAEYRLAVQSIRAKQEERFKNVLEYYKELVDKFPESQYLAETQRMYADSMDKINLLKLKKV